MNTIEDIQAKELQIAEEDLPPFLSASVEDQPRPPLVHVTSPFNARGVPAGAQISRSQKGKQREARPPVVGRLRFSPVIE